MTSPAWKDDDRRTVTMIASFRYPVHSTWAPRNNSWMNFLPSPVVTNASSPEHRAVARGVSGLGSLQRMCELSMILPSLLYIGRALSFFFFFFFSKKPNHIELYRIDSIPPLPLFYPFSRPSTLSSLGPIAPTHRHSRFLHLYHYTPNLPPSDLRPGFYSPFVTSPFHLPDPFVRGGCDPDEDVAPGPTGARERLQRKHAKGFAADTVQCRRLYI